MGFCSEWRWTTLKGLILLILANLGISTRFDEEIVIPSNSGFDLPPLPYRYDALEPYIDEQTMLIHHDKHHQGYVDKLNAAIEDADGALDGLTLTEVVQAVGTDAVPASVATKVRQNGGGHWNHSFFWKLLQPPCDNNVAPKKTFSDAFIAAYGSKEQLKDAFTDAASGVFGSGWAWLCVNSVTGALEVTTTPNQDNPLMALVDSDLIPVLGIDVWEHAYYLKHQNVRADYIDAWFKVVNWQQVEIFYENALLGQVPDPTI